jgi:hypothetical protein
MIEWKKEFKVLKKCYEENNFTDLCDNNLGMYFLKMRSLSRTVLLEELAQDLEIDVTGLSGRELFEFLFCKGIDEKDLDSFIRKVYRRERKTRQDNEDSLYSQLYKLKVFDWGGFYQNAVEQTIVNNYIKKIQDYDDLVDKIDNDISPRLKNYVLCSWYNHWTSILIEDMFKDHATLLPTVGLIKKVDFFWNDFPFDLKVTYFPDGYMELKRKERGLKPELTELKRFARENDIPYDRDATSNNVFTELLTRISEDKSAKAKAFIQKFHEDRKQIIEESRKDPTELMKWLYEEQGIRRFDAANRFFVILIEPNNLEESWKLKRNKKLLSEKINDFLNKNKNPDFAKLKLSFEWEDKTYNTYCTSLFIVA